MTLDITDTYPKQKPEVRPNLPYRNWQIWWWDSEDKKHNEFIKQPELEDVVLFCKLKGIKKYSIFDDKFKNVNNDGERVLMG